MSSSLAELLYEKGQYKKVIRAILALCFGVYMKKFGIRRLLYNEILHDLNTSGYVKGTAKIILGMAGYAARMDERAIYFVGNSSTALLS